ncbi:MAG: DegT/DnrJ/EryC1/StrS family aminotransferase, partial [Promethearchaeota archaeon]
MRPKLLNLRFVPPALTPVKLRDISNGLLSALLNRNIVKDFEEQFAKKYNLTTAESYNSWLGGLVDIFKMLSEISSRDKRKVVLPAFSCDTFSLAIKEAGLIPVYCDIELKNLTIDLDSLANKIDKDTLA